MQVKVMYADIGKDSITNIYMNMIIFKEFSKIFIFLCRSQRKKFKIVISFLSIDE